jgi:hypothetical protein
MSDTPAVTTLPAWRNLFKTPSQLQETELKMLVDGFMPPGITFLGGPAGHGKSWLALSLAKALYHGKPFLGYFEIPKAHPIMYLVPEVGESAIAKRLKSLELDKITDGFLLWTLSSGPTISLKHIELLAAVRDLKPVVFLDTTIRFNSAEDENSSSDNKPFVESVFNLLQIGAPAVAPLHHSSKHLASNNFEPTLETTLRGTGDLGASADAAYCVKCTDKKNFISDIINVKTRDFEPPESFEVQGRPYIDETHDLLLRRAPGMDKETIEQIEAEQVQQMIITDPYISQTKIAAALHIRREKVSIRASAKGWIQRKPSNEWIQTKR